MTTCDLHPDTERPCPVCGVARVRAALAAAPRPPAARPDNDTHTAAIARARTERLEAARERIQKETQK